MKVTSKEYALQICKDNGLDESHWGVINSVACDGYFEGQQDAKKEPAIKKVVRKIWLAYQFSYFSWKGLMRQEPDMTGGDIEPLIEEGILVKNARGTQFKLTSKAKTYL